MRKEIYSNWPYIFWFLCYFTIFWLLLGGSVNAFVTVLTIYSVSIVFALLPAAESLWRNMMGVRELATMEEKERLLPLFDEVYHEAVRVDSNLSKNIQLYIQEDMDINAFAFGKNTLVLTRGSIQLLSDECLKGLMAHEFGHFSHYDTVVLLIAVVGNILLSFVMKAITVITRILLFIVKNKDVTFSIIFKMLYRIIMRVEKVIQSLGDIILMAVSREHEYMADAFAVKCGYASELVTVLSLIYETSISKPGSIIEQLKSTHPPITERIREIEKIMLSIEIEETETADERVIIENNNTEACIERIEKTDETIYLLKVENVTSSICEVKKTKEVSIEKKQELLEVAKAVKARHIKLRDEQMMNIIK